MASEGKHISIVALNGTNYPTWKVQCRMALIREGLWGIVSETEECPDRARRGRQACQVHGTEGSSSGNNRSGS